MRHVKQNTPQSLYVDLALSNAPDTLQMLLENTTITPAPDINYELLTELKTERYTGRTNIACLLAVSATPQSVHEKVLRLLISKGLQLDRFANTNQDPSYTNIKDPDNPEHSKIARPTAHFLEFLTCSRNEALFTQMLSHFSDARLQELCQNTQLIPLCISRDWTDALDTISKRITLDVNHIPPARIPFSSHLDASLNHKNTHPCTNAKSIPMLEKLIDMGARLTLPDVYGKTPVQHMMQNETLSKTMLTFITQKALQESIQTPKGSKSKKTKITSVTQIDPVLVQTLFEAISSNKKNNTSTLLKNIGLNNAIQLKGPKGENLLTHALEAYNFPLIKRVLAAGADIHARDDKDLNFLVRFLTLDSNEYQRSAPDRRGLQRDAVRQLVLQKANFSDRNSKGQSLFWQLWGQRIDDQGQARAGSATYITHDMIIQRLIDAAPQYNGKIDPLITDSKGVKMIENITLRLTSSSSYPSSALSNHLKGHYHTLLTSTLEHPDSTKQVFQNLLMLILHPKHTSFWQYSSHYHLLDPTRVEYHYSNAQSQLSRQEAFIQTFQQLFDKAQFDITDPKERQTLEGLELKLVLGARNGGYQQLYHELEKRKMQLLLSDQPRPTERTSAPKAL